MTAGVDWVGRDGASTAHRYAEMATHVASVSPSYERLCLGVASDPELAAVMRSHRTQTNEPRRLATLLPVLARLPQPLALLEVGTSAGLCLYPDRYGYRYDGGPVLGNPDLVLDCATEGPVPLPDSLPEVVWRGGLDLNPLDVGDEHDRRWLESLIWPEEAERFETLYAAAAVARREPADVVAGDLARDLVSLAQRAPAGATLVVFHSAVLAYVDDEGRAAFRAQLAEIASRRPVVWLANEVAGVAVAADEVPDLRHNEFVLSRDGVPLGLTDSHGTHLRWLPRSAREWSL